MDTCTFWYQKEGKRMKITQSSIQIERNLPVELLARWDLIGYTDQNFLFSFPFFSFFFSAKADAGSAAVYTDFSIQTQDTRPERNFWTGTAAATAALLFVIQSIEIIILATSLFPPSLSLFYYTMMMMIACVCTHSPCSDDLIKMACAKFLDPYSNNIEILPTGSNHQE